MKEIQIFYMKRFLFNIENCDNVTDISKKIKIPISNASTKLKELEENGLVVIEKRGRHKLILLTEKGAKIKALLKEIERILKE